MTNHGHWTNSHQIHGWGGDANPDFATSELLYQLQQTTASIITVHSDSSFNCTCCRPVRRVYHQHGSSYPISSRVRWTILTSSPRNYYHPYRIRSEEQNDLYRTKSRVGRGNTKVVLLKFSSDTAGRPKLSHLITTSSSPSLFSSSFFLFHLPQPQSGFYLSLN